MSNGGGSHTAARKEWDQAMPGSGDTPHEVDFSKPNVARMYDYYLGGKDNYPADREAARLVLGAAPDIPLAALENREFLKHAMRFLMREQSIRAQLFYRLEDLNSRPAVRASCRFLCGVGVARLASMIRAG